MSTLARTAPNSSGQGTAVWTAVALAVLVRVVYGALAQRFIGGDQLWYLQEGHALNRLGGLAAYPSVGVRPPGLVWLVALLGGGNDGQAIAAVQIVNSLACGVAVFLAARVAALVTPTTRWAPAVAAWLVALDAYTIDWSSRVMPEPVAMAFQLGGLLAAVSLTRTARLGPAVGLGVSLAGAALFRPDGSFEGLVCAAGLAAFAVTDAESRRRRVVSLGVAFAVAASLTAAWRIPLAVARSATGRSHDRLAADFARFQCIHSFMREVDLPQRDWLQIVWSWPAIEPHWVPDEAFDTPDERRRFDDITQSARLGAAEQAAGGAALAALGAERRVRSPVRSYLLNPLYRLGRVWFHPYDREMPRRYGDPTRGSPGWWFLHARGVSVIVGGVGFSCSLVLLLRRSSSRVLRLVAGVTVARSVAWGFVVPHVLGITLIESRYFLVSHVVALITLAATVAHVVKRRAVCAADARGAQSP